MNITLCVFFPCRHLKDKFFIANPRSIDNIKKAIERNVLSIPIEILPAAVMNFMFRFYLTGRKIHQIYLMLTTVFDMCPVGLNTRIIEFVHIVLVLWRNDSMNKISPCIINKLRDSQDGKKRENRRVWFYRELYFRQSSEFRHFGLSVIHLSSLHQKANYLCYYYYILFYYCILLYYVIVVISYPYNLQWLKLLIIPHKFRIFQHFWSDMLPCWRSEKKWQDDKSCRVFHYADFSPYRCSPLCSPLEKQCTCAPPPLTFLAACKAWPEY